MTSFKTSIIKVSILISTLPLTLLGNIYKDVKADESRGLYITGNYGSSSINQADWKAKINLQLNDFIDVDDFGIENIDQDIDHKGTIKFKSGSGWETGIGYDFGRLRTELSYSQSSNDIKSISAKINQDVSVNNDLVGDVVVPLKGEATEASASGDLKISNIFINSYLDFPIGEKKKFTPYIGGGIGGSKLDIANITVSGEELEAASTWLFGYQWKLGLNYSISKNLNIFGEGTSTGFSDLGAAGEEYGLESKSDLSYRGGFRLNF